jgi:hypothetical protein
MRPFIKFFPNLFFNPWLIIILNVAFIIHSVFMLLIYMRIYTNILFGLIVFETYMLMLTIYTVCFFHSVLILTQGFSMQLASAS